MGKKGNNRKTKRKMKGGNPYGNIPVMAYSDNYGSVDVVFEDRLDNLAYADRNRIYPVFENKNLFDFNNVYEKTLNFFTMPDEAAPPRETSMLTAKLAVNKPPDIKMLQVLNKMIKNYNSMNNMIIRKQKFNGNLIVGGGAVKPLFDEDALIKSLPQGEEREIAARLLEKKIFQKAVNPEKYPNIVKKEESLDKENKILENRLNMLLQHGTPLDEKPVSEIEVYDKPLQNPSYKEPSYHAPKPKHVDEPVPKPVAEPVTAPNLNQTLNEKVGESSNKNFDESSNKNFDESSNDESSNKNVDESSNKNVAESDLNQTSNQNEGKPSSATNITKEPDVLKKSNVSSSTVPDISQSQTGIQITPPLNQQGLSTVGEPEPPPDKPFFTESLKEELRKIQKLRKLYSSNKVEPLLIKSENPKLDINGVPLQVDDEVYAEINISNGFFKRFLVIITDDAKNIVEPAEIKAPENGFITMSYLEMYDFVKNFYVVGQKCNDDNDCTKYYHSLFYNSFDNPTGTGLMQILYSKFLEEKLEETKPEGVETNANYLWYPAQIKRFENDSIIVNLTLDGHKDQTLFSNSNNLSPNRVILLDKDLATKRVEEAAEAEKNAAEAKAKALAEAEAEKKAAEVKAAEAKALAEKNAAEAKAAEAKTLAEKKAADAKALAEAKETAEAKALADQQKQVEANTAAAGPGGVGENPVGQIETNTAAPVIQPGVAKNEVAPDNTALGTNSSTSQPQTEIEKTNAENKEANIQVAPDNSAPNTNSSTTPHLTQIEKTNAVAPYSTSSASATRAHDQQIVKEKLDDYNISITNLETVNAVGKENAKKVLESMLLKRAKKQEEEAASAAAAAEEKKRQEEAAASKIGAFYRTAKQKKQEAAAAAAKEKENKIVSALGENWQQSLNAALKKQIVTGATIITAINNFLNDQNDDKALQTITTEGVNELTTFLSKIPPATGETPPTKFAEIVRAIESKLNTFLGPKDWTQAKYDFVRRVIDNFKKSGIENLKSDEGLNTLKIKCPKCIEYWQELSSSGEIDFDKIFNLFIPEYNDFRKYILTQVYELEEKSRAYKIVSVFWDSFLFLCRLLEYMLKSPGNAGTSFLYLYKKLNLDNTNIILSKKVYNYESEESLKIAMFDYFKGLLAQGISKNDKDKIDGIVNWTGEYDVSHQYMIYIILVSYKYLVFSKEVYWWYGKYVLGAPLGKYYSYTYTAFLDEMNDKNNYKPDGSRFENFREKVNTIFADNKYYYKGNKDYDKISYKVYYLTYSEDLEKLVHTVLFKLGQIENLNGIIGNDIIDNFNSNKKGGKTMKHRIMKKRKTKRRPKKKPLGEIYRKPA
jgi:colicin import membrane protein